VGVDAEDVVVAVAHPVVELLAELGDRVAHVLADVLAHEVLLLDGLERIEPPRVDGRLGRLELLLAPHELVAQQVVAQAELRGGRTELPVLAPAAARGDRAAAVRDRGAQVAHRSHRLHRREHDRVERRAPHLVTLRVRARARATAKARAKG